MFSAQEIEQLDTFIYLQRLSCSGVTRIVLHPIL